ncbi:acyltransferase [Arthrobacter sp. PAMC 25486]|uniref:acyltransferase family protein n=1 Tax=Arthrobacter sp. PAMC 25486 TaxID=1494608 RepID=UPI000535B8E3|nr:acyltransferase [Arthrobacter sp. PAMC 25486]AIY01277.1 acyltransferase [Arthrobacter sp. PAMC 25486]
MWFGSALDVRNNSLNLIRLILAFAVLVHHSWPLAGQGETKFAGYSLGGWAVAGFFGISGYLITSSRWSNALGHYLVNRIARIMPAFWVCLLMMALVFAPIGYRVANGSLEDYFTAVHSPLNYVFSNALLDMQFHDISATPANVPYPGAWNGSLWSLYYEFLCYLFIAALGCFALVRRSRWPMTIAFVLSVVAQANIETISRLSNDNFDVVLMLQLLPFFLAGSVLFMWRDMIGFHWLPGSLSLIVAFTISSTVPGWGVQASALFVAYSLIWLSTVVRQPKLIAKNDISYGVYIYAFAVQQLLAVFGIHELGLFWFSVIAAIITVPLAAGSWVFVERPVMRKVRGARGKSQPKSAPAAAVQLVPGV